MVQAAVGSQAAALRVAEYLRACALPGELVDAWSAEISAEGGDLREQLVAAQQRRDAWLRMQAVNAEGDAQSLRRAQAALPFQPDRHCPPATPAPAPLEMPTQAIALRSVDHYIDRACVSCRPLGYRLGQRLHSWLRSL